MKTKKGTKVLVRGSRARTVAASPKTSGLKLPKRTSKITNKPTSPGKTGRTVSPLVASLLETAHDMHSVGVMDKAGYEKITMRHLGSSAQTGVIRRLSGTEIRKLRERANMSQGVFAKILNITPGYVSQLERGDKEPTGSTLALLNVIRRKGMDAVL